MTVVSSAWVDLKDNVSEKLFVVFPETASKSRELMSGIPDITPAVMNCNFSF